MLQVKRIGHATLSTPDLERQLDYYTRVVGLSAVAKEKGRVILATKPGQEAIVLEHGERPAGVRLAFQVAPGSDLGELSARFFFNDTASTEIYTLSLHDALPI